VIATKKGISQALIPFCVSQSGKTAIFGQGYKVKESIFGGLL
jgi:hypothetical protein